MIIVTVAPERGIGFSLGAARGPDQAGRPGAADGAAAISASCAATGRCWSSRTTRIPATMMRHTDRKDGSGRGGDRQRPPGLSWLGDNPPPVDHPARFDDAGDGTGSSSSTRWPPARSGAKYRSSSITARQLTAGERERLLRQAQKVLEKATATRGDFAAAIGAAMRRLCARGAGAN